MLIVAVLNSASMIILPKVMNFFDYDHLMIAVLVALVLVGLQKQFKTNCVFLTCVCTAGSNNNNNKR